MARNQTFDEKIKRERNEIEKKKARTKGGRLPMRGGLGRDRSLLLGPLRSHDFCSLLGQGSRAFAGSIADFKTGTGNM